MVPGKTWVSENFASVSKSWMMSLKVSVLCVLFSLGVLHFLQKGLGALHLSFGIQTFLGVKGQNLSHWVRKVSVAQLACWMKFAWPSVDALFKLICSGLNWQESCEILVMERSFLMYLCILILCCFKTWIYSTVHIYNIIVHSVKFTVNHFILIPLSPLFPLVSSTESSLSIRT